MIRNSALVVVILAALFSASGCTIKANGVKVKSPGIEVGLSGGAIHCPPGQAKKGNC